MRSVSYKNSWGILRTRAEVECLKMHIFVHDFDRFVKGKFWIRVG